MSSAMEASCPHVFYNTMRHINCLDIMSMAAFASFFGRISTAHPYGVNFWAGFAEWMAAVYFPSMQGRGSRSWLANIRPTMGHFELPETFSRRNAGAPRHFQANPGSGSKYPAMFFFDGASIWMVCINIALRRSTAWRVDPSWLTLPAIPAPSSSSSSSSPAPLIFTTSTVVIEELDDDSVDIDEWVEV
jgi:hypothetical protein